MYYGNTADSRMLSADGLEVLAWRLNRVQDAFGNYMDYRYEGGSTAHRLQQIQYTGHLASPVVSPPVLVHFTYANRTDVNMHFMGVNAAALVRYGLRAPEKRLKNALPSALGLLVCLLLWLGLSAKAQMLGWAWLLAGVALGAWRTRGFRRELVTFDAPAEPEVPR